MSSYSQSPGRNSSRCSCTMCQSSDIINKRWGVQHAVEARISLKPTFPSVDHQLSAIKMLEDSPILLGACVTAVSAVTFQLISEFTRSFLTPSKIAEASQWKWKNTFVSFVHSVLTGLWSLAWYVYFEWYALSYSLPNDKANIGWSRLPYK